MHAIAIAYSTKIQAVPDLETSTFSAKGYNFTMPGEMTHQVNLSNTIIIYHG